MNISEISRRMTLSIIIIGLVSILASIIYYRSLEFLPFLLGVVAGAIISIVKIFLLKRAVEKVTTMEKGKAGTYISVQHMLRLLLSGAVLFLGALVPQISLWGVIVGILAYQLSLYIINIGSNIKSKEKTKK